jgi:hypothetical protein
VPGTDKCAQDGAFHLLAAAEMRAARVRPVARPQAFALCALLHKQFAFGIEDE